MVSLLIVDDDKEAREALLYGMDWKALNITQVRTARNGLDALAVLEEFMPDIILCDDDMPGMNGFQFGYCVREKRLDCRIIYIGGQYDTESLHAALQIGAVDFIQKPPDKGKLYEILDRNTAGSILEKTAAMQKYAMGMDRVSFYEYPVRQGRNYMKGQLCQQNYRQALLYEGGRTGEAVLREMTEEIAACGDERVYYIAGLYYQLLALTVQITGELAPEKAYTAEEEGRLWEEIHSLRTLKELEGFLLNALERFPAALGESSSVDIRKVMNYIRLNYSDTGLSVDSLAQKFFRNKAYLCTVFKRETGKTLNEFIIETRIEAAKKLLQGDTRIYEVADMVGIGNPNYFATTFKRYTGQSPSEFREEFCRSF